MMTLCFCFALVLGATNPTFNDSVSGLKLQFPQGWELATDLPEGTALFRANQPANRWIATFAKSPRPWQDVLHTKFFIQSMGLRANQIEVKAVEAVKNVRFEGLAVNYLLDLSGTKIRYQAYTFGKGGHSFMLVFGSRAANFNPLVAEMESVLQSIAFDAAKAATESSPPAPALDLTPLKMMMQPETATATDHFMALLGEEKFNSAEAERLLGKGADLNGLRMAGTPLIAAVKKDNRQAVLWLLDHGAALAHPANDITKLALRASLPIRMLLEDRWQKTTQAKPWLASDHNHGKTKEVKFGNRHPEADSDPTSNLFNALASGDLKRANQAVAAGAKIDQKNKELGVTPLILTRQLIKDLASLKMDTSHWRTLELAMVNATQSPKQ